MAKTAKKKTGPRKTALKQAVEQPKTQARANVDVHFRGSHLISENSDGARDLYSQSRYGIIVDGGCVQLSILEGHYLQEKGKIRILDGRGKEIGIEGFRKKAKLLDPLFWTRYLVFKDMRDRGYIIKTALKFGADFRVYDRGIKPGEDHAKWVVFPVHESSALTWYEFAAKNRVAHSTKKRLMLGIVDDENDVTYYEIKWVRP
ncbi:MAG: tRNA-intron lyase [Nanoarchaeota archaeon]